MAFKDNFTDQKILETGKYEENIQRIMRAIIREDWNILDIGANTGVHTVLMATHAPNGTTYAFEPVGYNYRKLNMNVCLSGLKNISTHPWAVGEKTGKLSLKIVRPSRSEQGSSSFVLNEHLASLGADAFYEEDVNVTSLDEFVKKNEIKKIDFIKMDIEGYEYWALLGLRKTILADRPVLIIEYNVGRMQYLGLTNDDMKELLGEHYDCYEISKFDHETEYSLDPFGFDRYIEADLLCISRGNA